ncbi:probable proline iminopeptidase [Ylistrum balloti]|uniref:probable proline iminopeptidase n=1 Tax=Ylistrum balloti TaxID=509963 RepID=UPI0029059257|nr:probable proline iminopeptidase [Ylistrum balloti]
MYIFHRRGLMLASRLLRKLSRYRLSRNIATSEVCRTSTILRFGQKPLTECLTRPSVTAGDQTRQFRSNTDNTMSTQRGLFPEIEPFDSGKLKVSEIHDIYYEQSGNNDGNPVIFIHGGPGGGTSSRDRRYFDPKAYRIILFDQRGAGKSTPSAELRENTTWDLVEDIEHLRKHLGINKWVVFGGSWGSTLSLTYAETHPDRVKALVLRGIFNLRRRELLWFYQDGANHLFPDHWESYLAPIPEGERGDLMGAYYRHLTSDDEEKRIKAAKAWSKWEMATSRLLVDDDLLKRAEGDIWSQQFARIESHYFVHGGWFKTDTQILDDVEKIRHIPATIIQGRYDVVCPMETAWLLHKKWPEADFHVIPDAGHSTKEAGVLHQLVEATDKYKNM